MTELERIVKLAVVYFITMCVFSSLSLSLPTEAWGEDLSEAQLQNMYMEFLTEEGYLPEIDDDGDIRFKYEGRTYFIIVNETDQTFFQILLPNIYSIENEEKRAEVLAAADHANALSKVAKVHTVGDNTYVSVELLVATPEDFKKLFKRSMSLMTNGMNNFANKIL